MDVELIEVQEFLARHAPFDELPEELLSQVPRTLKARYHRRDSDILRVGDPSDRLFIVRSGAVEIRDADQLLVDICSPGDTFGASVLLRTPVARHHYVAHEDSLILEMPKATFSRLRSQSPEFRAFHEQQSTGRLGNAAERAQGAQPGKAVLKTPVLQLLKRPPIHVPPHLSVHQASVVMRDEQASSLLVVLDAQPAPDSSPGIIGDLVGIVTDRDLRNRVLAAEVDPATPVSEVMTPNPGTASSYEYAFQILMQMVNRNIHHVPVLDPDNARHILGLVNSTDMMRLEQASPLYLVGDIRKQRRVDQISSLTARLPTVLEQLVDQDASPTEIGRVMTAVGDAVERRLLSLAEEKLGPPPVPYCWVVLGSQARLEQGLSSDQDNAMIISDELGTPKTNPDHAAHVAYFASLARFVSDGLAACGYRYCSGGVMATNDRWRQPLRTWKNTFTSWISNPTRRALLNTSIFFDMRALHGNLSLFDTLRDHVLAATPGSNRFLTHLAGIVLEAPPPLGFFRGLVLEKKSNHRSTLNLKRKGTMLIVDIARVYALAEGSAAVNTTARLRAAMASRRLSPGAGNDLLDAMEFISHVRWEHQSKQVRAGVDPDNFVSPEELSDFERRNLKNAYAVVKRTHQYLSQKYPQTFVS